MNYFYIFDCVMMKINWKIFLSVWLCYKNKLENNLLIFFFSSLLKKWELNMT